METIKVPFITYIALINNFQASVHKHSIPHYYYPLISNTSSTLLVTLFQ